MLELHSIKLNLEHLLITILLDCFGLILVAEIHNIFFGCAILCIFKAV